METDIGIQQISDTVFFVKLQKEVYEKKAIMLTANDYTDECYIQIEEVDFEHIGVWMKLKNEIDPQKLHNRIGEFCNNALNNQIRIDLEEKFGNLRYIIYKKAFSVVGGIDE